VNKSYSLQADRVKRYNNR